MVNPIMIVSLLSSAAPVAILVYEGDWDALYELVLEHKKQILIALEAIALFVLGVFKRYYLGFVMMTAIIATVAWDVE